MSTCKYDALVYEWNKKIYSVLSKRFILIERNTTSMHTKFAFWYIATTKKMQLQLIFFSSFEYHTRGFGRRSIFNNEMHSIGMIPRLLMKEREREKNKTHGQN